MSDWEDQGFPIPLVNGYKYSLDQGFIRTPFDTEMPRQSRGWAGSRKTFDIRCHFDVAGLTDAQQFFVSDAYSWFTMPLQSGESATLQDHTVRAITPARFSLVDNRLWELSFQVETPITDLPGQRYIADGVIVSDPGAETDDTCCEPDDFQCCESGCNTVFFTGWVADSYSWENATVDWEFGLDDESVEVKYTGGEFGAGMSTAFLVGDITARERWVRARIRCTDTADNDYFGIAIGYTQGATSDPNADDWYVWAWKQGTLNDGTDSTLGSNLQRWSAGVVWPEPFNLTGAIQVVQTGAAMGSTGWVADQEYLIDVRTEGNRIRVYIDGVLDVDYTAPEIPNARIALYNCSQVDVIYKMDVCDSSGFPY